MISADQKNLEKKPSLKDVINGEFHYLTQGRIFVGQKAQVLLRIKSQQMVQTPEYKSS